MGPHYCDLYTALHCTALHCIRAVQWKPPHPIIEADHGPLLDVAPGEEPLPGAAYPAVAHLGPDTLMHSIVWFGLVLYYG
jgi:hypothetical protein